MKCIAYKDIYSDALTKDTRHYHIIILSKIDFLVYYNTWIMYFSYYSNNSLIWCGEHESIYVFMFTLLHI